MKKEQKKCVQKEEKRKTARAEQFGKTCIAVSLGLGAMLFCAWTYSEGEAEYIKEILSEDTVERLKYIKENPGELKGTELTGLHPHFLTCKNAGGKESLLLAVTLEELCIHTPGEVVHVGKPVLAMLFEPSASGEEYEVLLNSGLLY